MTIDPFIGEPCDVTARIVTSEWIGCFEPRADLRPGDVVAAGDVVGTVLSLDARHSVVSRFTGIARSHRALAGERVRPHEPLLWLDAIDEGADR